MQIGARRALGLTLAALVTSCTFGGLGNYEVGTCNAGHQTQKEDECDRLNGTDTTTCNPLQCEASTQRCVSKPRDDDRDGDPSNACGGTDCDDADPHNFGGVRAAERCDGRDNNCNTIVDEGLPYAASTPAPIPNSGSGMGSDFFITGESGARLVGGYVTAAVGGGSCIQVLGLTPDGGAVGALDASRACYFLDDPDVAGTDPLNNTHLGPAQPSAKLFVQDGAPNGTGAAFVATAKNDACGGDSLEYRWFAAGRTTVALASSLGCTPRKLGVSLPSLGQLPNGAAVVLWYETPWSTRRDPINGCAAATPAKLVGSIIANPSLPPAAMPDPFDVAAASTSIRPPATALVPGVSDALLVAAPSGNDVGLWLLDVSGHVTSVSDPVPTLATARGVSLSVGKAAGTTVSLALVAELGCFAGSTGQSIAVAFGSFDTTSRKATFAAATIAAMPSDAIAITPSIAWLDNTAFDTGHRTEWMLTWTSSPQTGPTVLARRYAADGTPLSSSFPFAPGLQLGVPAADGNVLTVDTSGLGFATLAPRCP